MTTIFSKIIAGEIPTNLVYEDDICIVIMDKCPSVLGQTLVIPKLEVDYIFDLPEDVYLHILKVSKKIALALDNTFDTERTCVVVEGFEVPHVHVKLYPLTKAVTNLNSVLSNTEEKSDEELKVTAKEIADQIK